MTARRRVHPGLSLGLLIVGQLSVDECAGAGGSGGHVGGAFSEPLQGLGVAERNGRFEVRTALKFGQVHDCINQTRPAPHR
jgi:hypothetical protein